MTRLVDVSPFLPVALAFVQWADKQSDHSGGEGSYA